MKANRPKVAQLLYSGLGGHAAVVFSIVDGDRAGAWVNTLGFLGVEELAEAHIGACADRNIPTRYVPAIAGKPWRSWPGLTRWLKDTSPDAVIIHSSAAILSAWRYCSKRGIPLIMVEHTPPESASRLERIGSRLGMLLADRVVILTEEYRGYLKSLLGFSYREDKVTLIANGIDIDHFVPAIDAGQKPTKPLKIGMAARFAHSKRQDILVDALAILTKVDPAREWQLSFAGDGDCYLNVRQQADGNDNIRFEGMLSGPDYTDWLHSLDIYCHASDGETLSTSILQAMGCGLPIVGTDIPGIRAQLGGEPAAGLLVEQSPEAFAKAIKRIADSEEERIALANAARQRTVDRYSHIAMFEAYDRVIQAAKTA